MRDNSNTPKVSIIVPVYNTELYLVECINSLIGQTYSNIEIILIDDGSTDKSGQICDDYSESYDFIRVIHKDNEGLGMARNTGLSNVRGQYVYFQDSDDYIDSDIIERLVLAIQENGADVCLTGFSIIDDYHRVKYKSEYCNRVYRGDEVKKVLLPKMLGSLPDGTDRIEMSASAQLYSMKHIINHNIRFVSERKFISEDLMFNLEYMQYANVAITLDIVGYYYRINESSLSHQYRKDRIEKSLFFYSYIFKRLVELDFKEEDINRHKKQFFISVRSCISQERNNRNDALMTKFKRIENLCQNSDLKCAINSYPVKMLGIKQRLFLFMLNNNMSILLYYLS